MALLKMIVLFPRWDILVPRYFKWRFWAPPPPRNRISCKVFVLPCRISGYQWGHCPRTQSRQLCFVRRSRNGRNQEREANKAGASGADMVTSEKHSLPAQMPSSCVGLLACNPKEGNICPDCVFFFLMTVSGNIDQINALTTSPPWGWTDNLILATDSYKYRSFACDFRHAGRCVNPPRFFGGLTIRQASLAKKP